ncbi:caspase recruitment domain-containing protein 10-like, partial [Silurus meridionalis]
GADSFYVRVNLDLFLHDEPGLRVTCNDILHVTDTRYNGKYQWRCARVDTHSAKPLQSGAVPNFNRAQQLLLVKLQTIALQQQDRKKKVRQSLFFCLTVLSQCYSLIRVCVCVCVCVCHEEHLIPYSLVQPMQVECKRPVIFSPSVLSHGLIERLLQPADSGLHFNTCPPASEHKDKSVFLLDQRHDSDHTLGIRLQSIQEVIKQDKNCLLQLSVSSVDALLKHGVYPIIIHIKPKDKKGRKFRKLLSCTQETDVMEVVRVEELQLEPLPLMFSTLQPSDWSSTDELVHIVRQTIHAQQGALTWLE